MSGPPPWKVAPLFTFKRPRTTKSLAPLNFLQQLENPIKIPSKFLKIPLNLKKSEKPQEIQKNLRHTEQTPAAKLAAGEFVGGTLGAGACASLPRRP